MWTRRRTKQRERETASETASEREDWMGIAKASKDEVTTKRKKRLRRGRKWHVMGSERVRDLRIKKKDWLCVAGSQEKDMSETSLKTLHKKKDGSA